MNWNIQTRSRLCSCCQASFLEKQTYQTTLFVRTDGSYLREDVCMNCKTNSSNSEEVKDKGQYVSQWQGVFQPSVPPLQSKVLERDEVEEVLRRIVELNDPRYVNVMYILAVMLERKRVLKAKDVYHKNERKFTIYEHSKTGDVFAIEDPGLEINQLENVQRDVCNLLEKGLDLESEVVSNAASTQTAAQELPGY